MNVSSAKPARVGVLGATGYTGRELVGLLAGHAGVGLAFGTSESEAGTSMRRVARKAPDLPLRRVDDVRPGGCDVVFSCLPHGESGDRLEAWRAAGVRVVDLSADLRVAAGRPEWARAAVYGLPELHREAIRGAELVANPGCYPTAALLALAPLLRRGAVADRAVMIDAASGVTGAGRSAKRELLFAEVAEDFRAYAVGNVHRHLNEMRAEAGLLGSGSAPDLVFTPHLLPVRRGILETIYVPLEGGVDPADAAAFWREDYAAEPFVDVLDGAVPSLRDVVGTNRVSIGTTPVGGVRDPLLLVVAAIDNLGKGAAGQAVQNMNLMLGYGETEGLE